MALYEHTLTGRGQVIDGAIADGTALLNLTNLGELNAGVWAGRGRHLLSGGAPFYGVYRCADDKFFAVGAIEPKFYLQFLATLGIDDVTVAASSTHELGWPARADRRVVPVRTSCTLVGGVRRRRRLRLTGAGARRDCRRPASAGP